MLVGEEHALGRENRYVAFALYGGRRAAMNSDGIVNYDPDATTPTAPATSTATTPG